MTHLKGVRLTLNVRILQTTEDQKYLSVVYTKKILAQNLLTYICIIVLGDYSDLPQPWTL